MKRRPISRAAFREAFRAACATLAGGGAVSELALLLQGFTRADVVALRDLLCEDEELPVSIADSFAGIRGVDGIPVLGDIEWVPRSRAPRPSRAPLPNEAALWALVDRGLAVHVRCRRTGRLLDRDEVLAEIAAAKALLAE
jgi:hypothetical protein